MKKAHLIPVLFLLIFYSCKQKEKGAADNKIPATSIDSFLVTDSSWGMITAQTDIAKLKAVYGESNLLDIRECDAECMDSIDVTKLFPGTKNEVTIYWDDTAYHQIIREINCFGDNPDWHSAEGIKMGSGLRDLLAINGKKISFYGFGWDYSGGVVGYNGGKLENSFIQYRLGYKEGVKVDQSLYGDTALDSDMPEVQKILDQIYIEWITLNFLRPSAEE